jgi:hypothetical protein
MPTLRAKTSQRYRASRKPDLAATASIGRWLPESNCLARSSWTRRVALIYGKDLGTLAELALHFELDPKIE